MMTFEEAILEAMENPKGSDGANRVDDLWGRFESIGAEAVYNSHTSEAVAAIYLNCVKQSESPNIVQFGMACLIFGLRVGLRMNQVDL